jgi:DNA-binding CsgD family transcriptional regulator
MLHGRGRECARVDQLLAEARGGHSGVLVLRGEAGIGKSALLAYAADRAEGMRVLRGVGVESESEFPFAAVHQLLHPARRYVEGLPPPQRAALDGVFGAGGDAGTDRFLVSIAVLGLLAEVAEEQPLVCLVDDAQWLDGASADALTFAARRLEAEGIVLLFAARDDDVRSFAAPGLPALRLLGLDDESAQALLPTATAPQIRDRLIATAGGNPLGLLELPASLSAAQLAGTEPLPDPLPGAVEVFGERVRRQPADTRTMLLVAAAEETGDLGVVLRAARALGVDAGALDHAEAGGLVRVEDAVVTFRHPLVRSAVYDGATWGRRQAVRRALAAVLDGDADGDRRAWHLAAAATGPDEEVAAGLERSARRARDRGGHAAAASAGERAADLTPDENSRARRLVAAAQSAWLAGQAARARVLLDRAVVPPGDPPLRAEADHLRGYIELLTGTPADAFAVLTAGSDLAAPAVPARAALMLADAGQIAWMTGDVHGLSHAAARLASLPSPGGAGTVVARIVVALDTFLHGDTARAATLVRDGVRLAEALAAEQDEPRALRLAGASAMFVGDDRHALALFTRAAAQARARGDLDGLPGTLAPLASLEAWTGRYSAAAATAAEGLRLAQETGQENPAAHLRGVLAWLAAVQGRTDECRAAAEVAMRRATDRRLGPPAGIATWALGLSELGQGRPEAAFEHFAALAAAGPGEGHPIVTLFAAADTVDAAVRVGREDHARTALATLEGWAESTGSVWGHALAARCHGLLAVAGKSEGYFAEALALHSRGGRPFDTARTELAYGQALRRQRRRADARSHLRAAHDGFARLGADPWAELSRVELRATGERARRRDPGTLTQLTPQELQVVRLVTEGATTREVAAQLFLSPRTVDYHLHKVFTKLGIASRAELPRLTSP